ncbi:TPA: hypothetical protein CPT89_08720 [Candidatus Gastranaerophilales bacterium HUM_11]|nr:predicted protein [Acinetobacter sp. CAG:196]DAA99963.1 MAG TPA: hypothetical protein CPT89_08720 [Candidatus Gastranaerophilales bacterium HUM_11]
MSGFKRLSLAACAVLLSLSSTAGAQDLSSGYTLTRVDEKGENTITKFEWNAVENRLVPVYYRVDLAQKEYGSGKDVKYFEWSDDRIFEEVSAPTEGKTTITARYDASNLHEPVVSDSYLADVTGDFVENSAGEEGAAIYNSGFIENITGNFVANKSQFSGGAIYNSGKISEISGNFIDNRAEDSYSAAGGAIFNTNPTPARASEGSEVEYSETSFNISGNFIGNSAVALSEAELPPKPLALYALSTTGMGGAIANNASIGNITGNFIGNYASGEYAYGGAISNDGEISDITGDFIGNYAAGSGEYAGAAGGAIANSYGEIKNITGNFIGNNVQSEGFAAGGAISNNDLIGEFDYDEEKIVSGTGIVNSSFYGNYAKADGEYAMAGGGAIMTFTDLNIVAKDGYTSVFSGNYTEVNGERDDNAIYAGYGSTINFEMKNGGKFVMADNIRGEAEPQPVSLERITAPESYKVNITGDNIDNTAFYMLNDMYDADLTVGQTTLNTVNDSIHTYDVNNFTLSNNTKMVVDVDLANETMDRFTSNGYGEHNGDLIVSGMNLLSDSKSDSAEIFFAEEGLKDNVLNGTGELPDKYQTAYTPIYKYNVNYDNRADGGYFVFNRGGQNSSDSFNPSVLSTPVANQAGSQAVINETVRFAFQHMDLFSQLPFNQRMAIINNNRYAISEGTPKYTPELEMINKGFWVKPFTSFETINLNHGPDVDAITYGTLVGFDSNFKELKRGWYNVQSIYGGYNGSQLSYDGVDTSLNGGVLGITETFYKGNFFTALTATAGANVGSSKTMYGNEDFTALLAGIGSKSGYNFEFKNGKYILQPILFMNYSFVNTFDYTNAAGVKIDSDPLHTFQINPQLKFISNLKNGWQPYASVGMVWNVLNSSKVRANDVILPKMSVDPYVEYGVGLQRNWKDRFTGFAQAMVRNGGRNGVALTFGFRWAIGKGDDL